MLDVNKMIDLARVHAEQYQSNLPFPHIVIDNFLPENLAEEIYHLFPKPEEMDGKTFQKREKKIASRPNVEGFPDQLKEYMYALNSHEVITFLEILTGIDGIVPDPHFLGGGLHQTMPGGKLGVHVDFNYHKHLRLDRRLNMLIFFNKDWKEEYGGHLELWDKNMEHLEHKVLPVFNRCVIFNTTDNSYHGHPEPLQCPDNLTRKSIALYYYSSGRPEDDAKEVFWTQHQQRPGEEQPAVETDNGSGMKKLIKEITPPILYRIGRSLFTNQNSH